MNLNLRSIIQKTKRLDLNKQIITLTSKSVLLNWSNNPETQNNFGDNLNPNLFSKMTGYSTIINKRKIVNVFNRPEFYFIGSTLDQLNNRNAVICGAGFKKSDSIIQSAPLKVLSVRGPLTKKVFEQNNIKCPENYGDPACLLSEYYNQKTAVKLFDVGIIPHYIDQRLFESLKIINSGINYNVIDINADIENFILHVQQCKTIVSSSLHGLITANSFGIPATWVKFSNNIVGGNFKYLDYYASAGIYDIEPIVVHHAVDLKSVLKKSVLPNLYEIKMNYKEKIFVKFWK